MILSVNDIHKSYGKEKVLKGITFEIKKPQIIALVGPNGSGKSTLLNIITNLISADNGEITILNKSNKDPEIFKYISFMQDNSVLYDYLTGYDHLQFIGDIQRIPKKQIMDTANRVGIDSYLNKKVGNYSLGMKQHLLLTMALLNKPKLMILDEPLNGLDPTSAIKVRNILLDVYSSGTTILLSSHNLGEIDRVTPHILFLKNGTLIDENISKYERNCYHLFVDNMNRAEEIMKKANVSYEGIDNKIVIYPKDVSLDKVFSILNEERIIIKDIEKKVLGTEERYKKIFEKIGETP